MEEENERKSSNNYCSEFMIITMFRFCYLFIYYHYHYDREFFVGATFDGWSRLKDSRPLNSIRLQIHFKSTANRLRNSQWHA